MNVVFLGSKMGQTKYKPIRTKYFLKFFLSNYNLNLEHIFLKMNTMNRMLPCKSNNQIIQSKTLSRQFVSPIQVIKKLKLKMD